MLPILPNMGQGTTGWLQWTSDTLDMHVIGHLLPSSGLIGTQYTDIQAYTLLFSKESTQSKHFLKA